MTVPQLKKEEQLNLESITWGDLTWVNIEGATERETEYLAQNYPFHPLDLDDCLSRIQRPKIDEYKNYLFLVFHFPIFNKEAGVTTPSQLSVFISERYLITLHKGELKPLVKLFRECQIDEESRQEYFSRGSGYLLYRIIDRLVDYCLPILNKIGDNVEVVEESIFSRKNMVETVENLAVLRRDVISFRRIIWPMRAVIGTLEPKIRRFTKADLAVYFGDTVDHLDKIWDGLDEYKEIIEGLNDTLFSLNNIRVNEILRVVTVLAAAATVLVVIPTFYGMNVPLPWGADPGGSPFAWIGLLLAMLAMMSGMLYFLHRKHWL